MPAFNTLSDAEIERRAHKRVAVRVGWLVHALVYVAVNALLMTLAWISGRHGAVYPLLGWGLGLALHGVVVWMGLPGNALYQRLLQRERLRMQPQRDPW